jgi:hypothetical protein
MIIHLVVAGAMAGLTWLLGWWGVPVAAVILGFVFHHDGGRAWRVSLGAMEGWAILLLVDVLDGPFARVSSVVGGAMSIPAPALILTTLLFAGLMAWSAAVVGAELGRAFATLTGRTVHGAPPKRADA